MEVLPTPELDSGAGSSEDDLEVDGRSSCSSFFLAMGSSAGELHTDMVLIDGSRCFFVDGRRSAQRCWQLRISSNLASTSAVEVDGRRAHLR